MHLASFFSSSDAEHAERRRRVVSLAITVVVHLLLLWMLLRLAPPVFTKMGDRGRQLINFNLAPDEEETTQRKTSSTNKPTHAAVQPAAVIPPPKIELHNPAAPWTITPGLEKFDVRQVPQTQQSAPTQSADASMNDEANGNSDSDRPIAYGAQGQPLYAAQWYREPTHAELNYYLKNVRAGSGYGEIYCQTVARYHVDHCEELGETPGTGFAHAVRDAAWQFLVLPARIGGRLQVGTWVVIRITYTEEKQN